MKHMLTFARCCVVFNLALLASGCSSSDNVAVYPVQGIVRFEGKPMAGGGSISFVPTVSQKGKNAGGTINPDGTFVMTTYTDGDGAMAGSFRVIINQSTTQEPDFGGDSDAPGAASQAAALTVSEQEQIPLLYGDPLNSPVTVTIEAKEKNELTIELNRDVPGGPVSGA